jgi:hypothetical protein
MGDGWAFGLTPILKREANSEAGHLARLFLWAFVPPGVRLVVGLPAGRPPNKKGRLAPALECLNDPDRVGSYSTVTVASSTMTGYW